MVLGRVELGEESVKIGMNYLSDEFTRLFESKTDIPEHRSLRALRCPSYGHDGHPRAWLIWDFMRIHFRREKDGHRKIGARLN